MTTNQAPSEKAQRLRENSRRYYHLHREERALASKEWRKRNKEYVIEKQRLAKRIRKIKAVEYLGGRCNICGKDYHPSIFEFHHTDPNTKDRDPSKMLQLSWKRLIAELDKCDLLCANCHRFTHHGDKY